MVSRCSYYEFVTREREFTSKLLVPAVAFLYGIGQLFLPSSTVRFCAHKWTKGNSDAVASWVEGYILVTAVFLVVGVPMWSQSSSGWKVAWCVVAVFRLCEILAQCIEVILGRIETDAATTLATIVVYVLQVVAIFTIGAEAVGSSGFGSDRDYPSSWQDFLYMTWNNMATLGNSYAARSDWGKLVVAGSNVMAILLFSVLLGFGIGKLGHKPPRAVPVLNVKLAGDTLTLAGTASSDDEKAAVEAMATGAWPNVKIVNGIQVQAP